MTSSVSFFAMMVGCGFSALTCPEIVKHSARNFNCCGVISQRHSPSGFGILPDQNRSP